jgi:hypothetical protein
MLKLKVLYNEDYKSLVLPDGFTISIQYNSGVFNFDSIPGSYSIPFEVPFNPHNNRLLEFPHNLSNSNQNKRNFKAQLEVNGITLHSGILEVEETSKQSFKCIFKFDAGSFASEYKDVLISDCELGGDQHWVWQNPFTNANSDFALPQFWNEDYHIGTPFTREIYWHGEEYWINRYLYNERDDDYAFKLIGDIIGEEIYCSPVCPFPYLYKIIQYLFNSLGYNIKSNFFSSSTDLKNIIIYNNTDAQQSTSYFDYDIYLQMFVYILDTFNLKNHVPQI